MIRFITEHWGWKLFALFCATLIWLGVASEPEMSTVLTVPVLFKDAPRALEVSHGIVSTVRLELSGISGRLKSFSAAPAPVVLDLSKVDSPGERTFNIDADNVKLPRGVTLVRSVPAQLRLTFEIQVQKTVPVSLEWSGAQPNPLRTARIIIDPPALVVVGPQSHVASVTSVSTDPVPADALLRGKTVLTSPYIAEPEVRFLNFRPVRVRAILK